VKIGFGLARREGGLARRDDFGRRGRRGAGRCLRGLGAPARLDGFGLFGLDLAAQTQLVGLAADAVRLRVLDARGVALDPDPEVDTEV
jgi:hypothetical protein